MNRRFPRIIIFLTFLLTGAFLVAQSSPALPLRLAAIPEDPRPGEPVTIAVAGTDRADLKAVLVTPQGRLSQASFFNMDSGTDGNTPVKVAMLAVPSTARPGTAAIRIESSVGILGEIAIAISPRDFVSEEIALDQSNTNILTLPDPQKDAEANYLWAILNRTGTDIYASGPFVPPVTSTRRTSFFGDRRVFRYVNGSSSTSIHAGVDYGVPKGTPVTACAAGKVLLARFRIVTGNSVVLEHFPGIYSLYYHLDEIKTAEGTLVETGTLLGLSGSTGLSTGPHLHWEIRVAGENTDPDAFTVRPILDKNALLTKINGTILTAEERR